MTKHRRKKGKAVVPTKKLEYNGVIYKSALERTMAKLLHDSNIEFEYEPETFQLIDKFDFPFSCYERQSNGKGQMVNRGNKKMQGITYTPDFIGDDFIIETKGYANESFPARWKLFKRWLSIYGYGEDTVIYKPQRISECEEVVKLIKKFRHERTKPHPDSEGASN